MLLSFAVTAVLGFAVEETLSKPLVKQPQSVAVLWLVNGLVVILVGYPGRSGSKQMGDLGVRDYVIIGLAQGVAALPGISRLGLTLGAGLLQRMTWSEALKLSFLLSLPTILAANLLEAVRYLSGTSSGLAMEQISVSQLLLDAVLLLPAVGCGLLALGFLNRFLGRRLLVYFGVYCLAAGSFFWLYLQVL
jgi:undecaprenyl-diphosphatase